jgi:hypothetical protein
MSNDISSWGNLDLTAADTNLAPGDYDALVNKSEVFSGQNELWWSCEVALEETGYIPPAQIFSIAVKDGSPHKRRVADGVRALNQLAKAVGVSLDKDLNPRKIQNIFTGKKIRVRCATARRDGVLELVVRKFLPRLEKGSE